MRRPRCPLGAIPGDICLHSDRRCFVAWRHLAGARARLWLTEKSGRGGVFNELCHPPHGDHQPTPATGPEALASVSGAAGETSPRHPTRVLQSWRGVCDVWTPELAADWTLDAPDGVGVTKLRGRWHRLRPCRIAFYPRLIDQAVSLGAERVRRAGGSVFHCPGLGGWTVGRVESQLCPCASVAPPAPSGLLDVQRWALVCRLQRHGFALKRRATRQPAETHLVRPSGPCSGPARIHVD